MTEFWDPSFAGLYTPTAFLLIWVLPLLGALALVVLALRPGRAFPRFLGTEASSWGFWIASRFALAVLYWCLLEVDVSTDIWHWAMNTEWMDRGFVIGIDNFLRNYYGPLFPYLQYAGRWVTPGFDKVGTIWIFLVGDAMAVFLGARLATSLLGREAGNWTRAWLLLDPLLWHQLVVRAQDESLFLGTLVAAAWLIHGRRTHAAMAMLAFGLCATKITYAPYAMAVLLAVPGSGRALLRPWALWGLLVLATYACYLATGAKLFSEGDVSMRTHNWGTGVSIPDALRRVFPGLPFLPALVVYGVSCFLVIVLAAWRFRALPAGWRAVLNLAAAHLVSLLFMPSAVGPYLEQGIFFLLVLGLSVGLCTRNTRFAFLFLALSSYLVVMNWTGSRFFSIPMKPVCIVLHAGALLLLLRWRPGVAGISPQETPGTKTGNPGLSCG